MDEDDYGKVRPERVKTILSGNTILLATGFCSYNTVCTSHKLTGNN